MKFRVVILPLACSALVAVFSTRANAFVIAYDDAADATYNSGWIAGQNGGLRRKR